MLFSHIFEVIVISKLSKFFPQEQNSFPSVLSKVLLRVSVIKGTSSSFLQKMFVLLLVKIKILFLLSYNFSWKYGFTPKKYQKVDIGNVVTHFRPTKNAHVRQQTVT